MPAICWTRYFLEAQGYHVHDNVLFQDNKSAILLEKNGKASSSKRTKHINIRYFFITDRVRRGDVSLAWCPTTSMTGDFMTKPLQGTLFRKFRDQIMGVIPAQDPGLETPQPGHDGGTTTIDKKAIQGLAPPETRRHPRSVLGVVNKRTKIGRSNMGSG
jgi:hypothetical protein